MASNNIAVNDIFATCKAVLELKASNQEISKELLKLLKAIYIEQKRAVKRVQGFEAFSNKTVESFLQVENAKQKAYKTKSVQRKRK